MWFMKSFFNRSGLRIFSSYKEEMDFDGAIGRNHVLLEGNPGYGISYTAYNGTQGGSQVFQAGLPGLFSYTEHTRDSSLICGPHSTPAATPMAGHVSLRLSWFWIQWPEPFKHTSSHLCTQLGTWDKKEQPLVCRERDQEKWWWAAMMQSWGSQISRGTPLVMADPCQEWRWWVSWQFSQESTFWIWDKTSEGDGDRKRLRLALKWKWIEGMEDAENCYWNRGFKDN